MAWVTPADTPTAFAWYGLFLPDHPQYREAVWGALYSLTLPRNWSDEGIGQDAIAEIMVDAFVSHRRVYLLQPGDIVVHAGPDTPINRLECDGALYNTADYPLLFAAIGYTWGGSGEQFQVPDLRARVPVGAGSGVSLSTRNLADIGGNEASSLTTAELPAHTHATHGHLEAVAVMPGEGPVSVPNPVGEQTGSAGSGSAFSNMPPFAVVRFQIVSA